MTLLQAALEDSLLGRLTDQLFSISLLVFYAVYAARRQKALEDKLDKYMEEDREEMKAVIQNNTRAFELFNAKVAKMAVLIGLLVISSCGIRKIRKEHSELSVTRIQTATSEQATRDAFRSVYRYDSLLGIAPRSLGLTLSPEAQKPVYNEKGEARPNTTYQKGNGVNINATANPDGTLDITANCDSMNVLVRALKRENSELREFKSREQSKSDSTRVIVQSRTVKTGPGYSGVILSFAAGIACAWLFNWFQIPTLIKSFFTRA